MILLAATAVVRKRSGAPRLTARLFFAGESLNVSVRQLRSATQKQGKGQRLRGQTRRNLDAAPNLRLRWREWR